MGRIYQTSIIGGSDLISSRIGMILGTGWSDQQVLAEHFKEETRFSFSDLKLKKTTTQGHAGQFLLGNWDGKPVVISQGRIHLHEVINEPLILRQWMGTILSFMGGGNQLLITNAVGGNVPDAVPQSIAVPCRIGGAEKGTPYLKSEFVVPDQSLPNPNTIQGMFQFQKIGQIIKKNDLIFFPKPANYIMIKGPGFGGRADRLDWRRRNFHLVGMSLAPELYLIAVENQDRKQVQEEKIKIRAVQLITDNNDAPTHQDNQAVAHALAPKLGNLISDLIALDW